MAALAQPPSPRRPFPWLRIGIGIGITALIVVFAILSGRVASRPPGHADPAYVPQVQATATRVSEAETMMAGSVIYVEGTVTNHGTRPVTSVAVTLRFQDPYGQLVQKERATVVSATQTALAPGATRNFRVGFDHISAQWNQAPPGAQVVSVFTR